MAKTLDIILAEFPGRITLSVDELAPMIHMSAQYIRREVRSGKFPIPWTRIGVRIMFPIAAVVTAIDNGCQPQPIPRRRGRPTKAESIKNKQAQYSLLPEQNHE